MKELGTINRGISRLISEQGHGDLLMVCDAGFAIPKCIIRTADFTAYGNVILISGAGDRWYCEKKLNPNIN